MASLTTFVNANPTLVVANVKLTAKGSVCKYRNNCIKVTNWIKPMMMR